MSSSAFRMASPRDRMRSLYHWACCGHRRPTYVMTLPDRMPPDLITTSATRARSHEDKVARISTMVTSALSGHLCSDHDGLPAKIGELVVLSDIQLPQISAADILERHVAAELAEKTSG